MAVDPGVAQRPYVLGPEEGPASWYVNNRAVIKASAAQTGGAFGLLEMHVAPGHGPPLHVHHREDEGLWVLEGRLLVRTGDREVTAGPGAFIYTPRGVPHTFRVEGPTPPRLLVLVVPGGGEGFFVDAGRPADGPGLPPPAPPDLARLQAVAARYHMEFVGPPL
jgi:mannose-6-phosphate isomerase-like protein (cupin superfamily)